MIKMKLEEDLFLYTFPAKSLGTLGRNIYLLLDGKRGLLLDCGYEVDMKELLDDLQDDIEIVEVIPSHFHPDHIKGVTLLNHPKVYGNRHVKKTIRRFVGKEEIDNYMPTDQVKDGSLIEFGSFKLKLEYGPGHSECSMMIHINDKYLHVGDLYIKTDMGGEVLPYVSWKSMKTHMMTLKKIKAYKGYRLLISHGKSPVFEMDYKLGIDDRLKYMEAVIKANNRIAVIDAVKACERPFENMQWRQRTKK